MRWAVLLLLAGACARDSVPPTTCADAIGKTGTGKALSLRGQVTYEDKVYDSSGFTGAIVTKPSRFASVELVRCADSRILTSGATDANGEYLLAFSNSGLAGVYLRVVTQTDPAAAHIVVRNNVTARAIYAVTSEVIDDSQEGAAVFLQDVAIGTSSPAGGAFHIMDVLVEGSQFVEGLAGEIPPAVVAFWQATGCDGTFFTESGGGSIHVIGKCGGDADEYDDPVLLHEYGHFVVSVYSRDNSPGGIHFINDNRQDIRLSWSEGWATFFSGAVSNSPVYVDTSASGICRICLDLEMPPSFALYTTNELAVSDALWDIFDTPFEALVNAVAVDTLSQGINPIWDVFVSFFCPPCFGPTISMEAFWDSWFALGKCGADVSCPGEMRDVTEDRKMEFFEDGFEQDGSVGTANSIILAETQHRTIFPVGDVDYTSFAVTSGTSYTLRTFNLTNGATLLLEIVDGSDVLLQTCGAGQNPTDNCSVTNTFCTAFSKDTEESCPGESAIPLLFTAPSDATVYARITRSPSAASSSGLYGSYDFQIN